MEEGCDSEPSKCDFELTNFNPTGASTRFFKPSVAKKSVIKEVEEENEIETKSKVNSNNSIGGSVKKPTTQETGNEKVLFSAEKEKLLTSLLPRDLRSGHVEKSTKIETTTNTIKSTKIVNFFSFLFFVNY